MATSMAPAGYAPANRTCLAVASAATDIPGMTDILPRVMRERAERPGETVVTTTAPRDGTTIAANQPIAATDR